MMKLESQCLAECFPVFYVLKIQMWNVFQFDTRQTKSNRDEPHDLVQLLRLP